MQTARIGQAVVLMMIVALAASCSASKEYTSKLFAPRNPAAVPDSQATALRFLELDNVEPDQSNWVTTDIITGRDTTSKTFALDKFAASYPATTATKPDPIPSETPKTVTASTETKAVETEKSVATKKAKKKTKSEEIKTVPVPEEVKPVEEESVPVARNVNSEEVRSKRSREK